MKSFAILSSLILGLSLVIACGQRDRKPVTKGISKSPKTDVDKDNDRELDIKVPGTNRDRDDVTGLPESSSLHIDCVTENHRLKASLETTITLQRLCSGSNEETPSLEGAKRSADIVFVLDVTKSMQPNIDTIKDNLVTFSSKLITKGWDARFAAVTFRDAPGSTPGRIGDPNYELLYRTNFLTASDLETEIRSGKNEWIADDLSDYQEGGQIAISQAIDMLAVARPDAERIIVYVSDAPAYSGIDHWDFSIGALANQLEQAEDIKFYHSTLDFSVSKYSNLTSSYEWTEPTSFHIARNQMDALVKASGVSAKSLDFPLTANVLLQDLAGQFQPASLSDVECFVVSAEILDRKELPISEYNITNINTAFQSRNGTPPSLIIAKALADGDYNLQEERCCVEKGASVVDQCSSTIERTIGIEVFSE